VVTYRFTERECRGPYILTLFSQFLIHSSGEDSSQLEYSVGQTGIDMKGFSLVQSWNRKFHLRHNRTSSSQQSCHFSYQGYGISFAPVNHDRRLNVQASKFVKKSIFIDFCSSFNKFSINVYYVNNAIEITDGEGKLFISTTEFMAKGI